MAYNEVYTLIYIREMFIMNVKFDMGLVKTIGRGVRKYGTLVVVEGVKAVALQGAGRVFSTALEGGPKAVKELTFDDIVGVNKKKSKLKLLGKLRKKNEAEELLEEISVGDELAVGVSDDIGEFDRFEDVTEATVEIIDRAE